MTLTGKSLVDELVKMLDELEKAKRLLQKHGICEDCGEMWSHEILSPFASCGCKGAEWTSYAEFTPYMKLEFRIQELGDAIEMAGLEVPAGKFMELLAKERPTDE